MQQSPIIPTIIDPNSSTCTVLTKQWRRNSVVFTLTVPLTDLRLARKLYVHLHHSFKIRAAGYDFVASRTITSWLRVCRHNRRQAARPIFTASSFNLRGIAERLDFVFFRNVCWILRILCSINYGINPVATGPTL